MGNAGRIGLVPGGLYVKFVKLNLLFWWIWEQHVVFITEIEKYSLSFLYCVACNIRLSFMLIPDHTSLTRGSFSSISFSLCFLLVEAWQYSCDIFNLVMACFTSLSLFVLDSLLKCALLFIQFNNFNIWHLFRILCANSLLLLIFISIHF